MSKDAKYDRWVRIIRSEDYPAKHKALKALMKYQPTGRYEVCSVCGRVGRRKQRRSHGKKADFMYHYSREEGKSYCSIRDVKRYLERKRITCPRCGNEGLFSEKKEVHRHFNGGEHIYAVTRVVVRHGRNVCYINKEELKKIRKHYKDIKNTRIISSHPVSTRDEPPRMERGWKNKAKYDPSRIRNKLGISLGRIEKARHTVKTLEGQLRAKNSGKAIKFDVGRQLIRYKDILNEIEMEVKHKREREIRKKLQEKAEDENMNDEWFSEHLKKFGIEYKNHE